MTTSSLLFYVFVVGALVAAKPTRRIVESTLEDVLVENENDELGHRILADPTLLPRLLRQQRHSQDGGVGFKIQSATSAPPTCEETGGVGPSCGVFPIPAALQLDPSQNFLQPRFAVGRQTFPVYDPTGLAFPQEVTDTYGYLLDYPTTHNGVGTQTGFALYCPTDAISAPLANGGRVTATTRVPASAIVAQGRLVPRDTTSVKEGKWPVVVYDPGFQQVEREKFSSHFVPLASQGACVLTPLYLPGDKALAGFQIYNVSAPNLPDIILIRKKAIELAWQRLAQWNTQVGSSLYGKLDLSPGICGGGSIGGMVCQVVSNGYARAGVPKPAVQPFKMNVLWDPSGGSYWASSDFEGYSIDQVVMHSEQTGDTLGMMLRSQVQNVVPAHHPNGAINTKNTVHEMEWPETCYESQLAVTWGAYANLELYDQTNIWAYPNQTMFPFCAPPPFNNAQRPFMPVQKLVNLQQYVYAAAATWVYVEHVVNPFSMIGIEAAQAFLFEGQTLFEYHGNQICGPDVLGGCDQERALAEWHAFYDYSGAYSSQYLIELETSTSSPGKSYGAFLHNYCDCARNGQPCLTKAIVSTCHGGNYTCTTFPQRARSELALDPACNCPFGIC